MTATFTVAMSSVFTPPPSCSSHWTYEAQTANKIQGGLLLQNALYESQYMPRYPSGMDARGRVPSFYQVFSPSACPWYTTVLDQSSGSVTTAVCCESDFAYTTTLSSRNTEGDSAISYGCTSLYRPGLGSNPPTMTAFAVDTLTSGVIDGTTTGILTLSTPITMWGLPITVAFQEKDLSLFSTPASTMSTTNTPPLSTSIRSSSNSPPSPTSSSNPSEASDSTSSPTTLNYTPYQSLSVGAIAGIDVGAAAVVSIFLGLAIFGRRKRSSVSDNHNVPGPMIWWPTQNTYSAETAQPDTYGTSLTHAEPKNFYSIGYGEIDAQQHRRHELG